MHKEIQIDDFECMKDQRVERLLRNYIVQHGRRPKSILKTNKHGPKMHIKSRALSPSPKSPIRYIEIQNQDFGTVIDSLTKETEEPTVQFDEFMKGVDTSNLLVVCNSKTNLSEPSTMIKPKYTSVETKKIDFNSSEAKTKVAAKTHRGMTSKNFKNSEKKDFGDSKIIDIVAHNNLVVQNFNDCLKTASTGNIKIIDQDLNQLFGSNCKPKLKNRALSPTVDPRNLMQLNYAESMFDRSKMMTKYPKTPSPVVQTKNNRFVFKKTVKSGNAKGNLYMLKFPKWSKTDAKQLKRCRRCEIIRGPGALCNCPSKKMKMFVEGCQVVNTTGMKNDVGINTSNSLGFYTHSISKFFENQVYNKSMQNQDSSTK